MSALLEKSTTDIDQSLSTITAILRIAEVEQGRRRDGFGDVDLAETLGAVFELYGPIAEEKSVALSLDARPVAPVRGDGELLFEVVGNLLDNAIEFTPSGGRVALGLRERAGHVSVVVRNTGPGIPAGERAAVLRRFYRGDRSRSRPGTGLGLSLVAAIVRLHGFELRLDETPGGGCEASVFCSGGSERSAATT